ncbi:excalibur calcium-binding domain-containing protein [Rhodococcus parequi]
MSACRERRADENCDAGRAAGAAPLNAGPLGYSFDRDRDGVACE